jgi:hypothetical protein
MDDLTFNLVSDEVDDLVERLRQLLGLGNVTLYVRFNKENIDAKDQSCTAAQIEPHWQYGFANLTICVPCMADKGMDERAETIIHEFIHYFISPISRYDIGNDQEKFLEEKICTDLAHAIKGAMEGAAQEVGDHHKLEIKRLEKENKDLRKQLATSEKAIA